MHLFKDCNLNIALLISTSWHLLCIFSITPIFISGNINKNHTAVSFLGSILEKVVAVPEKQYSLDRIPLIQKMETLRDIVSVESSLTPPEAVAKITGSQAGKEDFMLSKGQEKPFPLKMYYVDKKRSRIDFKEAVVTGEARHRGLLYRPAVSEGVVLPFYFGFDYSVSVRFKISRHGIVERPECIVSSGSSEIDEIAIRNIREWQFVPHGDGLVGEQEGVVHIDFK
ncbi:MAG: energy transducer TonB [Candidatus Omnitrophica bacterium]|nr:energy transducer TonB [Candidatus Omnitrophota bacterium]